MVGWQAVGRQTDRLTDRQTKRLTDRQTNTQTDRQADTENEYLVKKLKKTAQRCNKLSSNIVFSVSLRCLCSWQITSENGRRIKPTYRWLIFLFWSDSVGAFFFGLRILLVHHVLVPYIYQHFQLPFSSLSRGVYWFKITMASISFADVPSKMERRSQWWCVVWVALCFIILIDETKRKSGRSEDRIQKFVHFCRYSGLGLY